MASKYLEAIKTIALKKLRGHGIFLASIVVFFLAFGLLLSAKTTSYHQASSKSQPEQVVVVKTSVKPTTTAAKPVPAPTTTVSTTPTKRTVPPSNSLPTPIPTASPTPGTGVSSLAPTSSSSGSSTNTSGSNTNGSSFTPVNYSSLNWSGYMVNTGSLTTVSGSWIAPSPTGNGSSTSADASWIGIGGVNSSDLIQVGTDNTVTSSGAVFTSAFYELLPGPAQQINAISVLPGDSITASITQTSPGNWTITITDKTDNQTYRAGGSYSSSLSSAEWIEEDPSYTNGHLVPMDNFGTASFSNCATTDNGIAVTLDNATPSSITMVNQSDQSIAVPSNLASNGFSVSWHSPG